MLDKKILLPACLTVILFFELALYMVSRSCWTSYYQHPDCPLYDNIGGIKSGDGSHAIDVVYTWVNGSDPRWKEEKKYWHTQWLKDHLGIKVLPDFDDVESMMADSRRFRDNEELRYSLRSVERYAPWVRKIFIVTDGQIPSWIDVSNPRLQIVKHSEIFTNKSHLPVFSSPAIESHLDAIPGLSDRFIYFNDDVFLGADVFPEDFISPTGEQKVYLSWEVPTCAHNCRDRMLGDGYCDKACNVTACDYDYKDCGCEEDRTDESIVTCDPDFKVKTRKGQSQSRGNKFRYWNPSRCDYGCLFSQIGDDHCDYMCNKAKCGFDGNDCPLIESEDSWRSLPSAFLMPKDDDSNHYYTIAVPDMIPSIYIDFTHIMQQFNLSSITEAQKEESDGGHDVIQQATLLEEQSALVVVFGKDDQSQLIGGAEILRIVAEGEDKVEVVELRLLILRGEVVMEGNHHLHAVVGVRTVVNSTTSGLDEYGDYDDEAFENEDAVAFNMTNLGVESVLEEDGHVDIGIVLPLHDVDNWELPMLLNATLRVRSGNQRNLSYVYQNQTSCVPVLEEPPLDDTGMLQEPPSSSLCTLVNGNVHFNLSVGLSVVPSSISLENITEYEEAETTVVDASIENGILEGSICFSSCSDEESCVLKNVAPNCLNVTFVFGYGKSIQQVKYRSSVEIFLQGIPFTYSNVSSESSMRWKHSMCTWKATPDDVDWIPKVEEEEEEDLLDGLSDIGITKEALDDETEGQWPDAAEVRAAMMAARKKRACATRVASILRQHRPSSGWHWLQETLKRSLGINTLEDTLAIEALDEFCGSSTSSEDDDDNGGGGDVSEDVEDHINEYNTHYDDETVPVLSADAFGDSLRYVNKLYNREFGRPSKRRRVPSHMPHMITKKTMREMKQKWPEKFEKTSTHRFRHPKDMQFSFSYFYYLMNQHIVNPPTLRSIWDDYLDSNHDGMLDYNEVLTAASLAWGDYPPSSFLEEVDECVKPPPIEEVVEFTKGSGKVKRTEVLYPFVKFQDLEKCDDIASRIVENFRRPSTYTLMTETEVTFHMLSDQYDFAWNQMQGTRGRRTKFICINDDMKNPTVEVNNLLNDLFLALWPTPSHFELPMQLRNKFDHIDDYTEALRHQYVSTVGIVFITMLLLYILYKCYCYYSRSDDEVNSTSSHAKED